MLEVTRRGRLRHFAGPVGRIAASHLPAEHG